LNKKYSLDFAKQYTYNLGFILLSDSYKNNITKLKLIDKEGYLYFISLNSLLNGFLPERFHKSNIYTIENIKNWLKLNNNTFILLTKVFEGSNKPLILTCKDGYMFYSSWMVLHRGCIPEKFHKSNPYTIQNIKLWCNLNSKQFELVSDKYNGSNKLLKWKCLKEDCGENFKSNWGNIISGQGCSACVGRQIGISNCLATKNPELAIEWNYNKNGDLTPFDIAPFSNQHVWWKCSECKREWYASINGRNQGRGCSICNQSKGEKRISKKLINDNILFEPQKEFEMLIGVRGGNLSYDFYLSKYNLLIEYQGEQHERYIPGFHGSYEDFERQVEHDKRKREYAKNNNINLLEIWYYDFDNIEEILNNSIMEDN